MFIIGFALLFIGALALLFSMILEIHLASVLFV